MPPQQRPAGRTETALIIACPEAEPAVADIRQTLDRSAKAGVPPHVTVLYPFKPDLTETDHATLSALFAQTQQFTIEATRTGRFGDKVVYIAPNDPAPLIALTRAVEAAFPAYPLHGGAFEEVVPHLTIAHDRPTDVLRKAESDARKHLPFTQQIDHVELWSGPALETAPPASWRQVRTYPLARRRSGR